ncbi:MAG: restriction endonuclease subunit S, partial [Roseburia sp.]|nr:restriction endonuclease subunit S [Roseburia sp.]
GKKYVESYIYKGDDNCYYEHIDGKATDAAIETPFDLPTNWCWAKLPYLGSFSSGKTPEMSNKAYWEDGDVQWFTSKDMKSKYLRKSQLKITYLAANEMTVYPAGTLLMVVRSGILKRYFPICILTTDSTINQDIKAFQLYNNELSDYIYYALKGFENIILEKYVKRITTVDSIRFDVLSKELLIPIPPLAEQQRIVDKINEIFAKL